MRLRWWRVNEEMKIKSINIKNFRSIKDLTIPLQTYSSGDQASNTAFLVGINESGKSAILKAISLINEGFKNIIYKDYCFIEAQKKNNYDRYINICAVLDLDGWNWKREIKSQLKLPADLIDMIQIKKIEKNIWSNAEKYGDNFTIEIDESLPFYKFIVVKTTQTVHIEKLSDFNKIEDTIVLENAENFLKDNQELLTKKVLEEKLSSSLYETLNQKMPKIQFWESKQNYLINDSIDLSKFKEDPNISIPLKNIFSIYGKNTKEEIKDWVIWDRFIIFV